MPLSPLSEDLIAELIDLLSRYGDRFQMTQGLDDDGWKLTITDRPSVPGGRMFIARSIGEARVMLAGLDQGLP